MANAGLTVRELRLRHVRLPLRSKVAHASHERGASDNVVVSVRLSDGSIGFGEGVPRDYVTGENVESVFRQLGSLDLGRLIGKVADSGQAIRTLETLGIPTTPHDSRAIGGNAAWCAVELALLDSFGRAFGQSLGHMIQNSETARGLLRPEPGPVRYSGAITASGARKEKASAWRMRLFRFHDVKVKVGVSGQDDPSRLATFRKVLGPKVDMRLDANEAWRPAELVDQIRPLLPHKPSLIEQPVAHEDVGSLAELRPRLGLPVMLDESLCGEADGRRAIQDRLTDFFNVRLSKCGGVFASLRLVRMAREAGLGVQLGCHPGESTLLSAAGRHFACNVAGIRYLEGSYDRFVLRDNVTRRDVTFGFGGRAWPIAGPGLGVEIDREALERLTVQTRDISFG